MDFNRKKAFLGKPIMLPTGVKVYSPTIDEIDEIEEFKYYLYLMFATFNKDEILKRIILDHGGDENEIMDDYRFLVESTSFIEHICQAISFFIKGEVAFDKGSKSFKTGDKLICNQSNYRHFVNLVKRLNAIPEERNENMKFKNEKARKLFSKLIHLREKYKKIDTGSQLEMKDVLSVLCSAPDNGVHIFNISKLTIYQVYEHFERMQVKESHYRLLPVWANGHLKDGSQLPEWIIKTTL